MTNFIIFKDDNEHLIAIEKIRYIKKHYCNLLCKLKDEVIILYYSDLNERDLDHERITKILTNPNTPTESVKGLLNTVKTKATETFNKTIEEPIGFYFEKDFNGVLAQFKKGEIANIVFADNAYYVRSKRNIKLFKAISEEGFKYGKLIY